MARDPRGTILEKSGQKGSKVLHLYAIKLQSAIDRASKALDQICQAYWR
jgi:hypothetical protein